MIQKKAAPGEAAFLYSAALMVALLIALPVLILVPAAVLLVVFLILVLILVIHLFFLLNLVGKNPAEIDCPEIQDLSLGLKRIPASRTKMIAAVIPAAVAFRPPVRMPRAPLSSMASLTPFANVAPKPVKGTEAPAPAKSMMG